MHNVFIALVVGTCLIFAPAKAEDSDSIKWQWTCKANAFYDMKVLPNSNYRPSAEINNMGVITITVKRAGDETIDFCNYSKLWYNYFFDVEGSNQLAQLYVLSNSLVRPECSKLDIEYDTSFDKTNKDKPVARSLRSVSGSRALPSGSVSISISLDDNEDWKFVINKVDINTNRQRRQLEIITNAPPGTYDSTFDTWMLTGHCLMVAGPSKE